VTDSSAPEIVGLVVGDDAEPWRAAGFTVVEGITRVGHVAIRLVGRGEGKYLRAWEWRALEGDGDLDGLTTTVVSAPVVVPDRHPNGASFVDHVVVTTPDLDRTIRAFEARHLDVRRVRHTDQYGPPFRQVFFCGGEIIVEVIGPDVAHGDDPARFFGLAFTVADLDATAALFGDALGQVKDAVQPGRRIATLRHRDLGLSVPIAFMTP